MKRFIINLLIVAGVGLSAAACYEDKSKLQTEDIPLIEIVVPEAIATNLTVVHGSQLDVEGLRFRKAGVENPEGLQYEWTVSTKDNDVVPVVLATTEEFHEVIDLPISSYGYLFVLTVTDPEYGLQSQYKWDLFVTAQYGEGILVGYTTDGKTSDVGLIMHPKLTEQYAGEPDGTIKKGLIESANGEPFPSLITHLLYTYAKSNGQNIFWAATQDDLMRIETDYYEILAHKNDVFVYPPEVLNVQQLVNTYQCTMILNDGDIYEELLSRDRLSTPISETVGMTVDNGVFSSHSAPGSTRRPSTVFYDKVQGKFCYGHNTAFAVCPSVGGTPFDPGNAPGLSSVAGGISVDASTHVMLMKTESDGKYWIYSFGNVSSTSKPPTAKLIYELPDALAPYLEKAVSIFFSLRDPVLYVATPEAIYKTIFETGSVQFDANPVYEAPAGEQITLARLYLQGYFAMENYESNATLEWSSRAVVVVTSKNDMNDRIHVVPQINYGSGQLDAASELVFDGFGKILDYTVVGLYK